MERRNWRSGVAILSALILFGATACSNAASPTASDAGTPSQAHVTSAGEQTGSPAPRTTTVGGKDEPDATLVPGAALQQSDLTGVGIAVVADDRAEVPAGSFAFSATQVERMLTEQAVGGGLLGSEIDAIAPMPAMLPPTSYVLQAWLAKGTSAAADRARSAMGDAAGRTDGIADIVYPTVVTALFVADLGTMIAAAAQAAGPTVSADIPATSQPGFRSAPRSIGSAPCTVASGFIASTIKGVFDFLKLEIPSTGGFFGAIVDTLASIWNYAVELARGVVTAVVGAITEEIFSKIRIVAAGLGAASILISYLKGQELVVTVEPHSTRVASGDEPDIPGRYIARAHPLSELWPPALMDCMTAAGSRMPELMLPGAVATWTLTDPPDRGGLVIPASLTTTVQADHRAYLDFVTGREPAEWADGAVMIDGPAVTVEVEQKGITDFLRETKDTLLGDLKAAIVGLIPVAQVRAALMSVIGAVLDPIAARIEAELNSTAQGIFTLRGHAVPIAVTYHRQPDPQPGTSPGGPEPDPFCDRIREVVAWGNAHEQTAVEPFSAEILRRLTEARTVAPTAMIGPVDAGIRVYAAGADGSPMAMAAVGLDGLRAWGSGAQEILAFCAIPAETWPQGPPG